MSLTTVQHNTAPEVVFPNFGAQPAKAVKIKPTRRGASAKSTVEQHPDFALINACVDFAKHTAAARAAFSVDPTDNNDFGAYHDGLSTNRALKSLEMVIAMHALTLDGLRAKASLVDVILNDLDGSPMEEYHEATFRSLAEDVKTFQQITGPTDVVFRS